MHDVIAISGNDRNVAVDHALIAAVVQVVGVSNHPNFYASVKGTNNRIGDLFTVKSHDGKVQCGAGSVDNIDHHRHCIRFPQVFDAGTRVVEKDFNSATTREV